MSSARIVALFCAAVLMALSVDVVAGPTADRAIVHWKSSQDSSLAIAIPIDSVVRKYVRFGTIGDSEVVCLTDSFENLSDATAHRIHVRDVPITSLKGSRLLTSLDLFFEPNTDRLIVAATTLGDGLESQSTAKGDPKELMVERGWIVEPLGEERPKSSVEDILGYAWSYFGMRTDKACQIAVRPRMATSKYPKVQQGSEWVSVYDKVEMRWLVQATGGYFPRSVGFNTESIALVRDVEPRKGRSISY
jgi:hypothetical protein